MKLAQKKKEEKEDTLKGTLASVMILGVFLIVSWFSVYALFLSR
nr:cytochrome c oxidase subunit 2A [Bacillus sp. V59.32b]